MTKFAGRGVLPALLLLAACNDPVGLPKAPPAREAVIDVAAAMSSTCALTGDHRTFCWIDTLYRFQPPATPLQIRSPEPFLDIASGGGVFAQHYCGQGESGAVYCWGGLLSIDVSAAIGNGITPARIGDGFLRGSLAVGSGHACALGPDSTARCWGSYNSAKRGIPGPYPSSGPFAGISYMDLTVNPVQGGERFVALSAGDFHTCGVRVDRTVACWGDSAWVGSPHGSFRHETETCFLALACTPAPLLVGLSGVSQVAGGARNTCALAANGAFCWGLNASGEFGQADRTLGVTPTAMSLPIAPVRLAVGGNHVCGLSASGTAWCAGDNGAGPFGDGTAGRSATVGRVRFGGQFTSLVAGYAHTCGIDTRGRLYCWGEASDPGIAPWSATLPVRMPIPE